MTDTLRASHVGVDTDGIHVVLTNGELINAPYSERLVGASEEARSNWELVGGGVGIRWPDVDEDLSVKGLYRDNVETPVLIRECRHCKGETRWNAFACDSCGKTRWNDPDDTKMGRQIGAEERRDYKIACARVAVDNSMKGMGMSENSKKKKRKGTWEEIERFQDPDSKITLILSERIRGREGYSIQIGHEDDMGFNKHIPGHIDGAKHDLKDILYSLGDAAQQALAKRKKS